MSSLRNKEFTIQAQIDAVERARAVVAGTRPKPTGSHADLENAMLSNALGTLRWFQADEQYFREAVRARKGSQP